MMNKQAGAAHPDRRILGVFGSFDELGQADLRIGRKVANYGFVSALLEYHQFDEIHFFLPFFDMLPRFEYSYKHWLELPRNRDKVSFFPALNLQAALERTRYTAIHCPEHHRFVPELCHQRNRWAKEAFPITCVPHSLNPWESHTRNLYKVLPGPMPYDSILCTSRAARSYLENSFGAIAENLAKLGAGQVGYGGRFDLVPLGVRAADFAQKEKTGALNNLGLEPGPITLLCVGRMTPTDKYDLMPLLGALRLCSESADIRLVVAGGAQEGYARNLKDTAEQMGLISRLHLFEDFATEIKPDLFAAADIYISPVDNLQETFGISIIEAMAAGLPVIASDFSGYRDLVVDGVTGLMIPTLAPADYTLLDAAWPVLHSPTAALQVAQRTALDMDYMVRAIINLANSPGLRQKMGEAGRKRALDLFDWPVVIARMEKTWLKLKGMALTHQPAGAQPDVMAASQARLFGDFPSRGINDADRIGLGLLYAPFEHGTWAAQAYQDLGGALPREGLKAIGELIKKESGVLCLAEIKTGMQGRMPGYAAEHLVLHGLKYGLFSLKK